MMMRNLPSLLSGLGLACLAGSGCGSSSGSTQDIGEARSTIQRVDAPKVVDADRATLASDNATFAINAYHQLTAEHPNLVFSPASVSIALSMAYAGAAGTTASEMAAALHFSLPADRLFPAFDALDLDLASRGQGKLGADGGPMRVKIVNAAWAERTYSFKSEYLDILGANYGAGINLLDFVHNWEPARITINQWVADQTSDRIKDLLPPASTDSSTVLVLTNAVYLNAAWKYPFDTHRTSDGDFTLLDGSLVKTKMMGAELSAAQAMEGDGFVAVSLPYDDERLSMLVVVPEAGTFNELEAALDAAKLNSIVAGLTTQRVLLALPRFRTETAQDFVSVLQALGMLAAFEPAQADFSGMDGTRMICISKVLHKAFIDVGEKGTEAAAATAVVAGAGGLPAKALNIRADRPFLYLLRDEPTGAILFMGRVLDPSKT